MHKELDYPLFGLCYGAFLGLIISLLAGFNLRGSITLATLMGLGGAGTGAYVVGIRNDDDEIGAPTQTLLLYPKGNGAPQKLQGGKTRVYWQILPLPLGKGPYTAYLVPNEKQELSKRLLEGHTLYLGNSLKKNSNANSELTVSVSGKATIRVRYALTDPIVHFEKYPGGDNQSVFDEVGSILQKKIESKPFTYLSCGDAVFKDVFQEVSLKLSECGITLKNVFIKDFTLPQSLLNLMMKEVQGVYEGRALGTEAKIVIGIIKELILDELGYSSLAEAGFEPKHITKLTLMAPELLNFIQASTTNQGYMMNQNTLLKDILDQLAPEESPRKSSSKTSSTPPRPRRGKRKS